MTAPRTLELPPKPQTTLSARLSGRCQTQLLQRYVIDVCDALARACRDQVGAVLPELAVIAAHFGAFTVEQAESCSLVLHRYYGATLPGRGVRS